LDHRQVQLACAPCCNLCNDAPQSWWCVKINYTSADSDSQVCTGVIDGKLKVYDTTNLRIVDASVMPLQVSAHLQSTLYGIAEKAASFIREDNNT